MLSESNNHPHIYTICLTNGLMTNSGWSYGFTSSWLNLQILTQQAQATWTAWCFAHKNWTCTPSSYGEVSPGTLGAVRSLFLAWLPRAREQLGKPGYSTCEQSSSEPRHSKCYVMLCYVGVGVIIIEKNVLLVYFMFPSMQIIL